MTPMHMAAINGHAAVIKLLIPNIDYDEEYFRGRKCQWSPIYYAAMNGHINVIKLLAPLTKYLNYKEPFPNGQETPDEVAARFNDYETSRKITNILKMQYVPYCCRKALQKKNKSNQFCSFILASKQKE